MKVLQASVFALALILAACDGVVSPTEPLQIESQEVRALPEGPGSGAEQPQGKVPKDEDDLE